MSILSPFPAWKLTSADDASTEGSQVRSPLATRAFKGHPSVAPSVNSAAPSTQALPRQKRFELRDGVQESIKAMKERVEAKKIVISDALYGFYSSEICLHFLHALSAYFIRVAKDCVAESRTHQPASGNKRAGASWPPAFLPDAKQGNINGAGPTSDNNKAALERAALLREAISITGDRPALITKPAFKEKLSSDIQVGQSYARVVVYCSNFERTATDALFFESLLYLARMVVIATVSEPSLEPELDKEFDRIFRGAVFRQAFIRPPPRPVSTRRRLCPAARGDNFGQDKENLSVPGKPRAVVTRSEASHSSLAKWPLLSPARDRCRGSIIGSGGGESDGGKTSRGINAKSAAGSTSTVAAAAKWRTTYRNIFSSQGRTPHAPSSTSKRAPGPRTTTPGNGGGMGNNEDIGSGRRSRRQGRPQHSRGDNAFAKSPLPPSGSAGLKDMHHPFAKCRGEEIKGRHILNRALPKGDDAESDGDGIRAPEALPSFDELSRWRLSRGSVPKMARLAAAVQRVALSNLALAESYRKSLAAKLHRENATPIRGSDAVTSGVADGRYVIQPKPQERFSSGTGAVNKPISTGFASRRQTKGRSGHTLACRRGPCGDACSDTADQHFFNAETISVCIASIAKGTEGSMAYPRFYG